MAQTSIEWFIEQIKEYDCTPPSNNEQYVIVMPSWIFDAKKEEAKEMESQQNKVTEDTSDGYHTFKELYEFRKVYNAALFNEWAKEGKYNVHKSMKHHDGELCFGGFWFHHLVIFSM